MKWFQNLFNKKKKVNKVFRGPIIAEGGKGGRAGQPGERGEIVYTDDKGVLVKIKSSGEIIRPYIP